MRSLLLASFVVLGVIDSSPLFAKDFQRALFGD